MEYHITLPLTEEYINKLKAGENVYLSGIVYSARDAAHKRLYEALMNGYEIPIDLKNNTIYYLGPTPTRNDHSIGSAGPTTSGRMDKYTPLLLDHGVKAMIGKGKRGTEVKKSLIENKGIYFAAVGGAGAYLSKRIIESMIIAYNDLGTEAIHKLTIEEFPVIVINDIYGNDYYELAIIEYKEKNEI